MAPFLKSGILTVAPIIGLPSALSVTVPVKVPTTSSLGGDLTAALDVADTRKRSAKNIDDRMLIFILSIMELFGMKFY